jgi:flagellar basal-body rod protein FlgF
MGDVFSIAGSVLSQAERRVEVAGQNLSNAVTPAYKRLVPFSAFVDQVSQRQSRMPVVVTATDLSPGKVSQTGNPAHLAIMSNGSFELVLDGHRQFSRQGQFSIGSDGRLVNDQGFALQLKNGGDLVVSGSNFRISSEGAVEEDGKLLGMISIVDNLDRVTGEASAPEQVKNALVSQGGFETSNVDSGGEIVSMMAGLRSAEAGQRIMAIYDELLGRALSVFGESTR